MWRTSSSAGAAGLSSYLANVWKLGKSPVQFTNLNVFGLEDAPIVGPVLFNQNILTYLSWVACAVAMGQSEIPRRAIGFIYVCWTLATLAIAGYGVASAVWQLMLAALAFNALETAGTIVWATLKQRHVPSTMLGRNTSSSGLRHILWIFAVSQLLAVVLVLFAVFFKWLLILGLIAFAVIGLAILYFDRR